MSVAERPVSPRRELPFVSRLWSRVQHRRGASTRWLRVVELPPPSPLLARLVRSPVELAPGAPVRGTYR